MTELSPLKWSYGTANFVRVMSSTGSVSIPVKFKRKTFEMAITVTGKYYKITNMKFKVTDSKKYEKSFTIRHVIAHCDRLVKYKNYGLKRF